MKITIHKMAQNVADLFTTRALHTQPPDESWAGKEKLSKCLETNIQPMMEPVSETMSM